MDNNSVKITVPASTANLGPGFDSLSLALNLYNEFTFKIIDQPLKINFNGLKSIALDENNLVYRSFIELYKKLNLSPPFLEINIDCKIPLSAGLGSSSTAIVAGLFAANFFLENQFSKNELLNIATKIEGHPDNCASAIYGGLTVAVLDNEIAYCEVLPFPEELKSVVVTPDFELPTRIAREVLPPKVPFGDATHNVSRTAFLLSCLLNKNWYDLKIGFKDKLHLPYRKDLVPGMEDVLNEALNNGAYGATLSGAGPTLIAFVLDDKVALKIGSSMTKKWASFGIKSTYQVLKVSKLGVQIEQIISSNCNQHT